MPLKNEYTYLIINGIIYSKNQLLDKVWIKNWAKTSTSITNKSINPAILNWQKSCHNFLSDWLDDNDFITVNTSGSTGKPKKIRLLKKRMINSALMTGNYFQFKSGQTALLCLPCDYIAGKMMIVRALVWGLDLQLVAPKGNPMLFINQAIDFAAMIPLQVANIFEQNPNQFKRIKQLIIGGGKVDYQLQEKLQTIRTKCYATYGMTETITHIAIKKLNGSNQSDFFQGLPNISLKKDDRSCLTVSAPHLSAKKIVTNDIINLKKKNQFEWLGRYDNVINTGGIKVSPEKIEKLIEKLIFKRFFISSFPDKKLENKVILIIEDQQWVKEKIDVLFNSLKQVLTKFELPKDHYFLDFFEETPTKKIHRVRTKEKVMKFNL